MNDEYTGVARPLSIRNLITKMSALGQKRERQARPRNAS